jgi:hypothetical protein
MLSPYKLNIFLIIAFMLRLFLIIDTGLYPFLITGFIFLIDIIIPKSVSGEGDALGETDGDALGLTDGLSEGD